MRILIVALLAFSLAGVPEAGAVETSNPLFGYTHLLHSPFTMPSGKIALGTTVAIGLTDFLQVGTDLIRDFYHVYNASAKVGVFDNQQVAFAFTGGWES